MKPKFNKIAELRSVNVEPSSPANSSPANAFYAEFAKKCREEFGESEFDRWLSKLNIHSLSAHEVIFSVASKFVRDWVLREFMGQAKPKNLVKIVKSIRPEISSIFIIHDAREVEMSKPLEAKSDKVVSLSKHGNVFAFGSELNPKFNFANYVSAKYNKLAVSMAKIAAGFSNESTNALALPGLFDERIPLFIHGEVGVGKTHLIQAIAWHIKETDPTKKVVYLSAEKFMYNFVHSVRKDDLMNFKDKMKSIDVLIVDDVQFIAGKQSTQREFMYSFNSLVEQNKQVILACDRRPNDLEAIDEKLKSRITCGMVINFKLPDFEDKVKILKSKTSLLNYDIPSNILEFLAHNITTNVRDLEGALKKLVTAKVFLDEDITLARAENMLMDYAEPAARLLTVEKIQKIIADHYGVSVADLSSASRTRNVTQPRQLAMFLAKSLTSDSLGRIGLKFGKRNHGTVIHACKLIQSKCDSDSSFKRELSMLEQKIKHS